MSFIRASLLFAVTLALLAFCMVVLVTAPTVAGAGFGVVALCGASLLVSMAGNWWIEEGVEVLDVQVPALVISLRHRWRRLRALKAIGGGPAALARTPYRGALAGS